MSAEFWAGWSVVVSAIAMVVSIMGYRHASSVKSSDLRIKVTDGFSELDVQRRGIEEFLEHASNSRNLVLNLRQPGGAQVSWAQEVEQDRTFLRRILQACPIDGGRHDRLSDAELEELLGAVRRSVAELRVFRAKYERVLSDDDQWRRDRAAAMTRVGR